MVFEIQDRDGAGRLGRFETPHGVVTTPALLPVLNPNLDLVSASEMRDRWGAQMVITNGYVLWRGEELRERALREGVHGVLGFDGPIMTDSGTFQMYVYGDVEVDPQEVVAFQRDVGSDVGTILDVFSTPDRTEEQARSDVDETVARGRAADEIKGDMLLALPVQGSVYPHLRTACAEAYRGVGDVHPIGGVVPLMERQRYADLVEVIVAAKRGLDPSKPVHLFGAGHPHVFALAALLGCDLFDSAAYAKFAKDDRLLFPWGTEDLAELEESPCPCEVCSRFTPAELRALPDHERLQRLAEHNLSVSLAEVRRVRQAIRAGRLWELVEQRARSHPALLEALRAVGHHADWIEEVEPLSKPSAFFYTGPESVARPLVQRYRRRLLERFDPRGRDLLVLPPAQRPFSRTYQDLVPRLLDHPVVPVVQTFLGPVPLVLDEAYPAAQSVAPRDLDLETRQDVDRFLVDACEAHGVEAVPYDDLEGLATRFGAGDEPPRDLEMERVRAVADVQFGAGAADALLAGDVQLVKSPRTGKVRNVLTDGEHVLSLRARDGFFTLKAPGARRLHAALEAPRLRVRVEADSVPFNRDGKSVFAGFVEDVDGDLRPGDECLVVGPGDELVAVGRLVLAPREVPFFHHGVACRVREGVPQV